MLDAHAGQETFTCSEDPETPIERKERAEEYMKNFQMIKMAQKFLKK
jgi:hypothetical protein